MDGKVAYYADLLALNTAHAQLSRVAVGRGGRGALGRLLLLQVLQSARQPKGSAVEVAQAQAEGQHKLVVEHQVLAPRRQVRAAYCQDILHRKAKHG